MNNRLANESSPYLLQHAHNPVDWYPWGEEALALARELDKPILLSIGYAACHWCHVMAHESFEDEETAAIMNQYFINIKVDREERPDLDSIYMSAVQALTGQGGWPMTVFLTPEGKPFYGGTYFPPTPRFGMPSFSQLLHSIAQTWQSKRDEIESSAGSIAQHLSSASAIIQPGDHLEAGLFDQALAEIMKSFEAEDGGFGKAPKFPPSMTIEFLLRMAHSRGDSMALHMAELTLQKMAYGGMYDQIGGGFARYSTDDRWLVPHFEKMLYDNALLARVYLHAFQVTGNPLYRRITEETLDFVAKELRHDQGGFYSSYDADSEGQEGKFYVWDAREIDQILGADSPLFKRYYDVSDAGNWEESNILNIKEDPQKVAKEFGLTLDEMEARLRPMRQKLYELRAQRIWPGLDDKVLTSWNGLMLAAFAEAGRFLERPDYLDIATANATFLYQHMRGEDDRLLRTWKEDSPAKYNAYLEDYAFLADALLALYEATFDAKWFGWAQELADLMLTYFIDETQGGFFDTSADHESLLYRPKDVQDNAIPSANAMAIHVLLKLSLFTGELNYWDLAEKSIGGMQKLMARYPTGFAHWLCAAYFMKSDPLELAVVGDKDDPDSLALLQLVNSQFRPNLVLAFGQSESAIPLLTGRPLVNDKASAYLCRRFVCEAPVNDPQELAQQLI